MNKFFCSLFAALAVAFPPSLHAADVIGGPITNAASGHVYYLLSESTWEAAEMTAKELGGHLATISSKVEQDWVFETFGRFGGDTNRSLWIGLHKLSGVWAWASGEIAPFTYWAPGEPNNAGGNEDAASMRIPGAFGHRFRFDPDSNPADAGQRSAVCRTVFRRHPDSNPGRSGQGSGPSGQRSGASGQSWAPP